MGRLRASNEEIVAAYRDTGSVWKAAKKLGLCGQSVHERLKAIGHPLHAQNWTDEEHAELEALAATGCPIGEIASRLGRPYAGVAMKLSRRAILPGTRRVGIKKPPRFLYTKADARKWRKELIAQNTSLRRYARQNRIPLEQVARVLQRFEPDFWHEWTRRHGLPESKECPHCGTTFYPLSKRQVSCTRKCRDTASRDQQYFGGKRNTTIGLAEGVCQLCAKRDQHALSSHHVLGKKHDPENTWLIALCAGCHKTVELLSTRLFVTDSVAWESLIALVLLRRHGDRGDAKQAGFNVYVDIEHYTKQQWREMHPISDILPPPHPIALPSKAKPKPKRSNGHPNLFNGVELQ